MWEVWSLKRTESKYPCVDCGYWVEITMNRCPNCNCNFTADDLTNMIKAYESNKEKNKFAFVIPFLMVSTIILAVLFVRQL